MKKIFRYKFLFVAALAASFASCSDDDDATLSTRLEKPVVTATVSSTTVNEGDVITVTLTSDKAINNSMEFKLDVLNTSTGGFRDLATEDGTETEVGTGFGQLGFYFTMPAYTTTYSFTFVAPVDLEAEGAETFNFRLYPDGNSNGNIAETSEFFTVTVNNTVIDDFWARLDWSQTSADTYGTLHGGTYDVTASEQDGEFCEFDFDMEIYDAGLNLVASSYTECPELAVLPADAPDGDYIIAPSFYTNEGPGAPEGGEILFKAFVDMGRPGAFKATINMDGEWTYTAGGLADGNDAAIIPVAIVTKAGTTYTATTMDGELLGTGRMANLVQQLAAKRKAHLKN
ncbi:hypothetical protein HUK80_13160 [Flavobacterium sp. MAH-1]|uniref:Uncharacterized protein n=1 Tax=Flavobacterium agri TaxID=2743471 RepID=A0A7Y8Y3D2_9FLAO|nr:hypothetical protein [Flavobacterium agri]NUY81850.1 hypothetical protein [Flavobacterium agri]NYA71874.1 hypothetical protein [Flavobacterium agri]